MLYSSRRKITVSDETTSTGDPVTVRLPRSARYTAQIVKTGGTAVGTMALTGKLYADGVAAAIPAGVMVGAPSIATPILFTIEGPLAELTFTPDSSDETSYHIVVVGS